MKMLRIGAWCLNPASAEISRDGQTIRVEERTMRLLLCLAERAGQVVTMDDLLNQVWPGVNVTADSVYQAVASLRRLLGDDPKHPAYIATVPRLGYRMIAPVTPWLDKPIDEVDTQHPTPNTADAPHSRPRGGALTWAAVSAIVVVLIAVLFHNIAKSQHAATATVVPQKSVAVLPFLDLTQGMRQEEFADGLTEELIDRLSKIPGLRVPPPTSSFYFKGKEIAIADIAETLRVTYVLDGSVRKSGTWVRIAARLVRADSSYIIWSETYDRPFHDVLTIQDDIAGQVTKALKASIEATEPKR